MLAEIFGVAPGDVVSITGAGGKTGLMFALAGELRRYKVLVTTTTKIYVPAAGFDRLCAGGPPEPAAGVCVAGGGVDGGNKLRPFGAETLGGLIKRFDITLIEADGARGKFLKCPAEHEPVIIPATTKTVAVLSLRLAGAVLGEENTHRAARFAAVTGARVGGAITLEHIANLVKSPAGTFKNAAGERILYINMVETESDLAAARDFAGLIGPEGVCGRILAGSLRNNVFYSLEGGLCLSAR